MRFAALIVLALLLSGCPPAQKKQTAPATGGEVATTTVPQESIYDNEGKFDDELKRLQELGSSRPSVDGLYFGHQDDRYKLGSSLNWPDAALTLTDQEGGGDWTLAFWQDKSEKGSGFEIINDETAGNGYRIAFRSGPLSVTLSAQWVHGRYLVCRREVVLEGLDYTEPLPEGGGTWLLDGPWMPYRMLPGPAGPFSVAPETAVDGTWHWEDYPSALVAPAAAAYDRIHGMLMCIADEHPKLLDRDYEVGYRIDPQRQMGGLATISYTEYDSTRDLYDTPVLASGLVRRDSVVLAPLDIPLAREPAQYVELPAKFVITELGKLTGAFQFTALPEGRLEEGAVLVLDEWLDDPQMLDGFGRLADSFGAHHVLTYGEDYVYKPGWEKTPAAGMPLLSDRMEFAEGISARILALVDPLSFGSEAYRESAGSFTDPRQPGAADEALKELSAKLNRFPNLHGVTFSADLSAGQPLEPGRIVVSREAATAQLAMALVEATGAARDDARSVLNGGLNLCMPPLADGYINSVPCSVSTDSGTLYSLNARFMNHVYSQVFGVDPIDDCGTTLAEQVLVTTFGVKGHFIHKAMDAFDGFGPFAQHQGELRRAGGDLRVLDVKPAACEYSDAGDIPAQFSQMVAIVPADWDYASAVWIAFLGVRGSVALDNYNNLSVSWGDPVQYWEGKLPPGLWSIDHPFPDNVQPGDAVVVIKKPISPPSGSAAIG